MNSFTHSCNSDLNACEEYLNKINLLHFLKLGFKWGCVWLWIWWTVRHSVV